MFEKEALRTRMAIISRQKIKLSKFFVFDSFSIANINVKVALFF
jgi:hypothetical protein